MPRWTSGHYPNASLMVFMAHTRHLLLFHYLLNLGPHPLHLPPFTLFLASTPSWSLNSPLTPLLSCLQLTSISSPPRTSALLPLIRFHFSLTPSPSWSSLPPSLSPRHPLCSPCLLSPRRPPSPLPPPYRPPPYPLPPPPIHPAPQSHPLASPLATSTSPHLSFEVTPPPLRPPPLSLGLIVSSLRRISFLIFAHTNSGLVQEASLNLVASIRLSTPLSSPSSPNQITPHLLRISTQSLCVISSTRLWLKYLLIGSNLFYLTLSLLDNLHFLRT